MDHRETAEDVTRRQQQQQQGGRWTTIWRRNHSDATAPSSNQRGGGDADGGDDDRGGAPSPFSLWSFGAHTGASSVVGGGDDMNDEEESESGSSSAHTGDHQSLKRRAQEFEQILQSQRNVLHDFDSPSIKETEDDDLQSELQDLARSEVLLRRELEMFTSSFRKPTTSPGSSPRHQQQQQQQQQHNDDEEDMDDASTLPDYGDPALIVETSRVTSSSSPPQSRQLLLSTPGMAPWTPPLGGDYHAAAVAATAAAAAGAATAAMDNRATREPGKGTATTTAEADDLLGLPTLDQLQQQQQRQRAPTTPRPVPDMVAAPPPTSSGSQPGPPSRQQEQLRIEEGGESLVVGGLMLPATMVRGSNISPLHQPFDGGGTTTPSAPRVSLEDEMPSLLDSTFVDPLGSARYAASPSPTSSAPQNQQQQRFPPQSSPTMTDDGGGLNVSGTSDDSMFADLARVTNATPRASNTKGRPNEPLYIPSPNASDAAPTIPQLAHGGTGDATNPTRAASSGFWSQAMTTPGVSPMMALFSGFGSSSSPAFLQSMDSPNRDENPSRPAFLPPRIQTTPATTASAIVSPSSLAHTPLNRGQNSQSDEEEDDRVGLLDDFDSSANWKGSPPGYSPPGWQGTNTTPFLSASVDDEEPTPPPGSRLTGSRRLASWSGIVSRKRDRSSFAPVALSTSFGSVEPPRERRRRRRFLVLLALLLIGAICAIVIPTSLKIVRDRSRTASSVGGLPGGETSFGPSAVPTSQPTRPFSPSSVPSESPTANPTASMPPTTSVSPSASPSTTPQPTISISPSFPPTPYPTKQPTKRPTDPPSPYPTRPPTKRPTDLSPPSRSPVKNLTPEPTRFPTTSAPTISPSSTTTSTPQPSLSASDFLNRLKLYDLLLTVSTDGGQALDRVGSPQHTAYRWLLNYPKLPDYRDERRIQRYAMGTIYFSLDGENWLENEGWLSYEHECTWFSRINRGVCAQSTDDDPSDGLRRMQRRIRSLRRLVLYYNNLHGQLPPEIGLLYDLEEIHLVGGPEKFISGSLPSELGNLNAVREVHLADNNLTGMVPRSLQAWSRVEIIDFSDNSLRGPLSDDLVGGWTRLYELNVSSNRFNGRMPVTFAGGVEFLDMSKNDFTGPVPASIGIMQELRVLKLDQNQFTSLPSDIVSLKSLEDLSVMSNRLEGPILPEIGLLPQLRSLSLANNSLTNTIPPELGNLSRLTSMLDLSNNNLYGPIPSELGLINNRLRRLRLAGNRLGGVIPTQLANLGRLAEVRLEHNNLEGSVPDALCRIWDRTLPTAYSDCDEVECHCCNYCCTDGQSCVCRYADDPDLAWRCF